MWAKSSPKAAGSAAPSRLTSFLCSLRDGFFSLDIYGYTPSLIVSEYRTLVSLITSLVVICGFITAVAYTAYVWAVSNLNQTEADAVHGEDMVIIPASQATGGSTLPLPQFGILLILGNGTYVSWADYSSAFKLTFQQAVVCNSDAGNKKQDPLPQVPCSFDHTSHVASAQYTKCVAWDDASIALAKLNNTVSNPCQVPLDPGEAYSVPRIVGTFYNTEYSYITATVSVNSSLLANAAFVNTVAKGSMHAILSYNFTSPGNLAQGVVKPDLNLLWSRRLNLYPNVTLKAEVLIRARLAAIHSYFWDVPSLERVIVDSSPWSVESYISIPGSISAGWTDIGKVYLRFDDRDTTMSLSPQSDALGVVSGWGGILSILLAIGGPAVFINQMIFQSKVKHLISDDKITFDEEVRTLRTHAVHSTYAAVGGKRVMRKPAAAGSHRRSSLPRLFNPSLRRVEASPSEAADRPSVARPSVNDKAPSSSEPSADKGRERGSASSCGCQQLLDPQQQQSVAITVSGSDGAQQPPRTSPADTVHRLPSSGSRKLFGSGRVSPAAAAAAEQCPPRPSPSTLLPHNTADESCVFGAVAEFPHAEQQQQQQQPYTVGGLPEAAAAEQATTAGPAAAGLRPQPPPAPGPSQASGFAPSPMGWAGPDRGLDTPGLFPEGPQWELTHDDGAGRASLRSALEPRPVAEQLEPTHSSAWSVQAGAAPPPPMDHQVASMAVMYDGDCFADEDEDENFGDVVRHATSECNALLHLRQVVKLVQQDSPLLTLWSHQASLNQALVARSKHSRSDRHTAARCPSARANSRHQVLPAMTPEVMEAWGERHSA